MDKDELAVFDGAHDLNIADRIALQKRLAMRMLSVILEFLEMRSGTPDTRPAGFS